MLKLKNNFKLYKTLFLSTLFLSAFTVGGGYVIVPLMKKKFVDQLGLLDEEEMLNMIVIAQSTPGPIAVNTSVLLGYRLGGFFGALCTILGAVIPPLFTISLISYFYNSFKDNKVVSIFLRGLQIGASALIINVVINMGKKVLDKEVLFNLLVITSAFIAAFLFKVNVVYIILAAGFLGIIKVLVLQRKIEEMKQGRRRKK